MLTSTVADAPITNNHLQNVGACPLIGQFCDCFCYIHTDVRHGELPWRPRGEGGYGHRRKGNFYWGLAWIFLLVKPILAFVVVLYTICFRFLIETCRSDHPVCADGTLDSVLHDTNNFWCDTYYSIWSQSTKRNLE